MATAVELPRERVQAARNAVLAIFAFNGMAFAAWASRIPDVKHALGLSPGELGLTLLFMSAGSVIGLPMSGWITGRLGAAGSVTIGLVAMGLGVTGLGIGTDLVGSRWVVAGALFAFGLGVGVWDVGMNLEGASVERLWGKSVMPHFHAAFSGGTVASALLGSAMSWAGVPVFAHLVGVGALVALGSARALRAFLPRDLEQGEDGDRTHAHEGADPGASAPAGRVAALAAWTEARTLLVGVMVLVAAFTEGTANDWFSVALVEGYGLPNWAGVLGFAVFLTFMTLGRLSGTVVLDRFGRVPTLRVMFAIAAIGSLMVVFGNTALAYVGGAVWGVGVSLGFPVGMSAAADDPARAPARLSVVATIGYTAFIAGPPLLGFLGDHYGVLRALLAVGAMLVVALAVLPAAREPQRTR
ncbi:MAG TPA: MFS transporter [Dermatophilaceae bacterium]|jgi:fucose permease|nr:MFS transporter [Dermatophilaceae bacterium]